MPGSADPFAAIAAPGMSPTMSFNADKLVESSPSVAASKNGKKDTSALDNIKW
jgi:hypothetical protein